MSTAWTPLQRDRARLANTVPELVAAFFQIKPQFAAAYIGQSITIPKEGGYRTPAVQAMAAGTGASSYNGATSFSKHQAYPAQGLDWSVLGVDGQLVTLGSDPRYRWVGEQFKLLGFKWGGDFQHYVDGALVAHPDWDHVETLGPQPNIAVVRAGYAAYEKATGVA